MKRIENVFGSIIFFYLDKFISKITDNFKIFYFLVFIIQCIKYLTELMSKASKSISLYDRFEIRCIQKQQSQSVYPTSADKRNFLPQKKPV